MNEKLKLKLEADCNSLNAIAGLLRHEGRNKEADCLLSIERHIFQILEEMSEWRR